MLGRLLRGIVSSRFTVKTKNQNGAECAFDFAESAQFVISILLLGFGKQ